MPDTAPQSLFEKVWNAHAVKTLENGQTQLFIGTHLIHEVTSPQAFGMLRDLNLTVRSYNCLMREGVHTVGELTARSEADLLDIRNFGQKSIDEVKAKLADLGLSLKDSPAGFDPSAIVSYDDDDDYGDQY